MKRTIGFVPMRALEGSDTVHAKVPRLRATSFAVTVGALAVACGVLACPAAAHEQQPPEYSLNITQGETTQPEDSIAGVSASGPRHSQVRLRIIQGGVVVNQDTGNEGGAWLGPVAPAVGDTVTVESPLGTVVGAVVYDGLPSIEPTVCAGSTNFSGQRSGADEVAGGFYVVEPQTGPYGEVYRYEHGHRGFAQVTLLTGASFGGNFLVPLALGETVWAIETVKVREPGWIFTYESETVRPVGACPAPPPPPPPAKPVLPPLQASLAKILNATIKALLKHGLSDHVYVNQPGIVTQALYLAGGKLPAYAASSHHKRLPPAVLLAKGAASVKAAGDVTVVLHLTSGGRGRVRNAKSVHAVLVTTVTSGAGVKITLAHRSVTLHG